MCSVPMDDQPKRHLQDHLLKMGTFDVELANVFFHLNKASRRFCMILARKAKGIFLALAFGKLDIALRQLNNNDKAPPRRPWRFSNMGMLQRKRTLRILGMSWGCQTHMF